MGARQGISTEPEPPTNPEVPRANWEALGVGQRTGSEGARKCRSNAQQTTVANWAQFCLRAIMPMYPKLMRRKKLDELCERLVIWEISTIAIAFWSSGYGTGQPSQSFTGADLHP
jgi:hypothetical protein